MTTENEHLTRIDTRVGQLQVEMVGDGPPALLWHSLFVDSRQWHRVRDELALHRRLVLVDGPAHGRSGNPPASFTLDDCADAAIEVLEALGLPAVDWVGTAWGGHVGLVLAGRHPGRLRSLVAAAAPVYPLGGAARLRCSALVGIYSVTGAIAPLTAAVVDALVTPALQHRDPTAVAAVREAFTGADRVGMTRVMRSVMLRRPDLSGALPRVGIPTLLIGGDDDPMWDPARAAEAAGRIPGGVSVALPGVRHLPPLEDPDGFIEQVHTLWARVRDTSY